jgi:prepilin-type N-terminal cleavage/methylation domain-containing protein
MAVGVEKAAMCVSTPATIRTVRGSARGFSLVEVAISLALLAFAMGSVIFCYMQACERAQWSGYALAAQGLAIQQLEQARAAALDPNGSVCEITNIAPNGTTTSAATLDLPVPGTNSVWATNYVGIRLVTNSVTPLVTVYMVRVDTVWPHFLNGQLYYFSNTAACYYAEDY